MKPLRSPLTWLVLLAGLVAVIWVQVTPRRAWSQLVRASVASNDADLMARVDTARLAANFRSDLLLAIRSRVGIPQDTGPSDTETELLNSLVATAVTPLGLRTTFHSFQTAGSAADTVPVKVSWRYHSPLEVEAIVLPASGSAEQAGHFTLRYSGSAWRLTRIRSGWLIGQDQP